MFRVDQTNGAPRWPALRVLLLACAVIAAPPAEPAEQVQVADDDVSARKLESVEVKATRQTALSKRARTGTRLDLSVRQTPASVTVISQDALRERGETTAIEALENAPGLVPSYSFGVLNLAGRGFSGVFNSPTLFDGVRYPGWQVTPRLTLNYQQIEVLRGPAALVAGQGATSGAVNLVPRRADGTVETQAYLGLGRYGTRTAALGHGGSAGAGALNYRVDLSYQGSDQRGSYGYARDTSFEFFHLSGELALPVSDALLLSVSAESFNDDAEGYFGTPLVNGRLLPALRETNFNVVDDALTMRVNWLRARAEWTPSAALNGRVLVYLNNEERGYRNAEAYTWQASGNSIRRSDFLHVMHDQELLGGYADLSLKHRIWGLDHQLVLGLQADRNAHDRYSDSPFRHADSVPLEPLDRRVYTALDPFGLRTATTIEQRSALLESALSLSARWKLVSGWRHDRSDVDSFNALSNARFDKRYSASSFRTGLLYSPDERTSWYAAWATASEPPAQITTLGLANAAFDLTRSKQRELGVKQSTDWGDWTLAAYAISRRNLLSRDPDNPNLLVQIGEQVADGLEGSLRLNLDERWSLDLGGSVLEAQFTRFDERVGNGLVSRRGKQPVAVPERMATTWLNWQASDVLDLSAGVRAVGRSAADTANTVFVSGYATLDLNARWQSRWGRFGARVRNVADRLYATRAYNGVNQLMLGEPRWFELTWQRSW